MFVVTPEGNNPDVQPLNVDPIDPIPQPGSPSGAGNVAPSQFLKEGLVTRGDARQVALLDQSWQILVEGNAGHVPSAANECL